MDHFHFNPNVYGPVFAPLLAIDRYRSLCVTAPNVEARPMLDALSVAAAFGHTRVVDRHMAACCLSAVWLLHDFLEESHRISQGIETTSGSYWHGIMHRREGDFPNAKYWFRRVGQHDVMNLLGRRVVELATLRNAKQIIHKLTSGGTWDPFAFVELCQAALYRQTADVELCCEIQQTEWEVLFDHCYRAAVGPNF